MIILTAEQAEQVRGISPLNGSAALDPQPLKDGAFELHEDVILDPANADVHDFLAGLPRREVLAAERYGKNDEPPEVPDWRDVGVRELD
jgi:hypothetical protein